MISTGDRVVAVKSLLTEEGEVIPDGTSGIVTGWQGNERVIVSWDTENGPTGGTLSSVNNVRAGQTATPVRSRSRIACGVTAAQHVVRRR